MNTNGHQNLSCTFAAQLVDYLYSEFAEAEKTVFESHLQNCRACADEAANFSQLRSSIIEWRENDFEPLQTPVFVLPAVRQKVVEKHSLIETIRSIFILSPMQTAFAALFVLLTFAGIFWISSSYLRNEDLASDTNRVKNENIQSPVVLPTAEIASRNEPNQSPAKEVISQKFAAAVSKDSDVKDNSAPGKISSPSAMPVVQKDLNKQIAPKTGTSPKIKAPVKNNIPAIDDEDEEDNNSLRLSDLFDEVGMNQPVKNEGNANDK